MRERAFTQNITWAVNPCSWRDAAKMAEELAVPHVVGMVLAGRGFSGTEEAREFLECSAPLPDPFLFSDMALAVEVLVLAIQEGRRIVVHGDYDADGITATALMVVGLRELGAEVDWYLPSRFKEGYGLSRTAVETIAEDGTQVLVTVDCGVNYPDEVALAKERGLEVVVVDHHEPGPILPDCCLIHSTRGDYPHGELCGVGLALKVLHALHIKQCGARRDALPEALAAHLDLVAVGTVADLSALYGENRYYVREGAKLLNRGQRMGLRALCEVVNCVGKVDSGSIAFRLAPRLNAAGRLADPSPPLRLLLSQDEGEARGLAEQLHDMNGARQELERRMFEAAKRQVESLDPLPCVLVLSSSEWHEGVVGIVASRMVEMYQRPAVLLCVREGVAKGSGRSIPAYDLLAGIDACGDLLSVYGGHAQAAGLTMDAEHIDSFRNALEEHATTVLSPSDLVPRYRADAVLASEDLDTEVASTLETLEPFGSGNPRPRFLVVDTKFENAERTRNGQHLKGRAQVGGVKIQSIGFGMGQSAQELTGEAVYAVGAQLKTNEWRGVSRAQLILERVATVGNGSSVADMGREGAQVALVDEDGRCNGGVVKKSTRKGGGRGKGLESFPAEWPASSRDLRGRSGALTAAAQVLGTGESAVVFATSAARTVETMVTRLPMEMLVKETAVCVSGDGEVSEPADLEAGRFAVVDWAATTEVYTALTRYQHILVLDPPHRLDQVRVVSFLAGAGATAHLLYGETEREETARVLRYLVHPRFAMVCLYNATRADVLDESLGRLEAARALGWEEARVSLTMGALKRAESILDGLGLDTLSAGKAKLDVRENAAYREAEADYEECVRSCLTL